MKSGWLEVSRAALLALAALMATAALGCVNGRPPGPGTDAGPMPTAFDQDGDTISDADEGEATGLDTDGDGTPDYLDDDSDGDGLSDLEEAGDQDKGTPPDDADNDGIPNFQDLDSDSNGIPDSAEPDVDFDNDGVHNAHDLDDDNDLIPDGAEIGGDPTNPLDFDGDGIPDYQDFDSDGDTISDLTEGFMMDTDGDGVLDRHDIDTDGDGIPDAIEAGDSDVNTPPIDTDMDMVPDFRDVDSDNDGLPDGQEDLNGNGVLDPGESDPLNEDTDNDGIPDLVETAAGTDPQDPMSIIDPDDFFFILPYMGPGDDGPLTFATDIVQADVHFSVDTTGSMGGVINNLQTSLTSTIAAIVATVPNTAVGVSGFEDYPVGGGGFSIGFGDPTCGDLPFYLTQRVTTDIGAAQAGVNVLDMPLGCGSDTPEGGFPTLAHIVANTALPWAGGTVAPYNAMTGYNPMLGHGLIGGVGFRAGSLPIVIHATDAISHTAADYAASGIIAPGQPDVVAGFAALGGKFIGISAGGAPRAELEQLARDTGSLVPTTAFSGPCAAGMCCTGINGAGITPDAGGMCPLVFSTDASGSGLGTTIIDAVEALVLFSALDISAVPVADPMELMATGINTANFITAITPVPPPPAGATINGNVFENVTPGTPVSFQVDAFNDFVMPATTALLFECTIDVVGNAVTVLDSRTVFIIVPPEGGDIPIQ